MVDNSKFFAEWLANKAAAEKLQKVERAQELYCKVRQPKDYLYE